MKTSVVLRPAVSSNSQVTNRSSLRGRRRNLLLLLVCLTAAAVLWLGVNRARMASLQSNVPAGSLTRSVALNSVTNKIYAANFGSNNVTVIDGGNHATTTVPVGTEPGAVAVNPVTNKIYIANQGSDNVTVIDGADNSTATVGAGDKPFAIAVNSVTNKIYVTNQLGNNVTVIDGADNSTATVPVGTQPYGIVVNPVTNKIYVANFQDASLTVINGADNSTVTVPTASFPLSIAVNPVTNRIYVAGLNQILTVINGADNSTVGVPNGPIPLTPNDLAVNPVTNKIYVANAGSIGRMTVLNGADNTTAFINTSYGAESVSVNPLSNRIYFTLAGNDSATAGLEVVNGVDNTTQTITFNGATGALDALQAAVNPVTNKVYVTCLNSSQVFVVNGADNSTAVVTAGTQPYATAVNPVTNKAYVANRLSNNVTVVNGTDNSTATVPTGTGPLAIAVNAVTNKTYVANHDSNDVTVINGADNSALTLPAGTNPVAIAVNAITNKIYVANGTSNNVTIINGADNSSVTVPAGPGPTALAINQVTNKTYVYNDLFDDTVTVINGADNSTVTLHTGAHFSGNPFLTKAHAIAVNSVTNKIYVANTGASTVTVINGADNSTATVTTGASPLAVAVNSITNKIYVSASGGANVTVINGADNTTVSIPTHSLEYGIAVDEATNEIYIANVGVDGVTVINGADNSKVDVPSEKALDVAINPVTHKLYLANQVVNKVSVVTEQNVAPVPLTVSITPQPFQPNSTSRSFTFTAASAYSPIAPPVRQIHYQLDSWINPWQTATPAGANPQPVTFGPLQDGMHILYAYATDGGDRGNSPHIGQIQSYLFFINSTAQAYPPPTITAAGPLTRLKGNAALNSTIANVSASAPGIVTVTVTSSNPSNGVTISNIANNAGTITADVIADCTASNASFTLTATDSVAGFATATLNVNVADDANDPPTAAPDTMGNIGEDSGVYSISAASLLSNDNAGPAAEANQTLTIINVSNAVGGSAQMNGANVEFTPALDFNGAAGFDYTIQDNGTTNCVSDPKTATAHVSFNITSVNDAPSFTKGADQTIDEDAAAQSVTNWATNISRGGGTDEGGQTLTFNVTGNTNPALFSVGPAISSTGTLSYTTAANQNGSATITLTLSDNGGGSDTSGPQNFTITVTRVNDAPTLTNNTGLTVDEGSGNTIDSSKLSVSDTDNSDDQLVFTLAAAPARGTLQKDGSPIGSGGTFTQQDIDDSRVSYAHDGGETTSDSFSFTVADGAGGTVSNTTFNITVNPVDDPPDINSNTALLLGSGATATIHNTNLRATDPDSATITFIIDAPPDHGQLKLNGTTLSGGSSFTQDDIDNDRVSYTNNGDEFTFDTFGFHLAGASFGSSFDISIICETSVVNTDDSGPGSLRSAIVDGCDHNIISFNIPATDPNYDATTNVYTIKLNSPLLLNKQLSIQGPVTAGVKISGENSTGVFSITAGKTVTLSNLTIANGQANMGGGIFNFGDLTIVNSTLAGNNALGGSGQGGAIDSESGYLTIINSTISGNTAEGSGGGLFNSGDSTATLINVTITGNRTDTDGSDGIDSSSGAGGGIAQLSSNSITLSNTIVAGNFNDTSPSTTADDIFVTPGANLNAASSLIGDAATAGGIASGANGNKVGNAGVGTLDINTVLNTLLTQNGGTTLTHLLKAGGPAVDAGDNALAKDLNNNALNMDQRGFARLVNTVDIGALEVQAGVPNHLAFTGQPSTSSAGTTINPAVTVQILDEGNNPTTSNANVTISIGTNPGGSTLGGTTTVAAVNGTASFSDLSISNAGVGYRLVAGSSGLAGITSNLFDIQKATQSITVGAHAPASATYNASFTVAATSSSGLEVVYSSAGVCTNVGPLFTMTTGTGTCTVRYDQSGDSNHDSATQVTETVTAQKANQSIAVSAHTPGSASFNNNFTVTASSGSGLPVSFSSAGACTNTGALFTITSGTGSCTVNYDQAGDLNYDAATQVTESVTAQKANQSITINTHAPASKSYNGTFTVAATSTSGQAIAFSSAGVCTNVGPVFTMTSGTGTCTVKYDQSGDGNYNAATEVVESVTAQKANQSITVGTHAPANAAYNTSFTVAATSTSGQAIAFSSAGVCTNVGPVFTMTSGTGTCTVKYDQSGDSNYNAATEVVESVTAQKANQSITVGTHAPANAAYNTSFTVAATSTSGQAIAFSSAGVCTNVGPVFTMTSGTGTCTVKYDQSGDGNYNAATEVVESVTAQKANQSITVGTHAPANAAYNTSFTVAATSTSGQAIAFSSAGVCTNVGPVFTMTSGTGTCTVKYDQSGDSNYNAATEAVESVTAQKANQSITVGTHAPANAAYNTSFTVAATSTSGQAIAFSSAGVCTNVGPVFTMTSGTGTCTVKYDQSGDGNYNAATEVVESVTAQKANQSITVGTHAPANSAYNTSFTVAATSTSGQAIAFSSAGVCTNVGPVFTMTSGTGTCTVKYDQSGDSNYNAATEVVESVTAQKANQSITVGTHAPANAAYNTSFTVAATANSGLAVSHTSSGVCTNVGPVFTVTSGTGICTVKYDQSGDSNYDAAPQVTESVTDEKTTTTLTVSASPNPSELGRSVTFAATVASASGTPTGTVQFKIDGANSGAPVALNAAGTAQLTASSLTAGTHEISADYSGDANFAVSTGILAGVNVANNQALVSFSNENFAVNESTGFVTITVNRGGNLAVPISVDYATDDAGSLTACGATNGLASSRCDFDLTLGTLQFAANETQKTFVIPLTQDSYTEGSETFTVSLSNLTGTGSALATPSTATVTIGDGTNPLPPNAIDDTEVFVRQQYRDFLNRDADAAGLAFWKNNIEQCNTPAGAAGFVSAAQCIEVMRINTSAAFFLSIEFQSTGNLVRSFYVAALDRPATNGTPALVELERDTQAMQRGVVVGQNNWQQTLNDNRDAFMKDFVMRPEFVGLYPMVDSPSLYVSKLYQHALGRTPTEAELQDGVSEFANGATQAADPGARGRVLLRLTQATDFVSRELNRSFVQMQYFGYLRRNPNDAPDADYNGYNFWLNKLNAAGGNYIQAEMVKAFLNSSEYRARFGP